MKGHPHTSGNTVAQVTPGRLFWLVLSGFVLSLPAAASELTLAASKNEQARVAALIASGADVNERGERGSTSLHWAAFNGQESIARLLLRHDAKVNAKLTNGSTPLHLAAYKGHAEVVRALLEKGANKNMKTRDGVRPIDWAKKNGHDDVVALLNGGTRQTTTSKSVASKQIPPEEVKTEPIASERTAPEQTAPEQTAREQITAERIASRYNQMVTAAAKITAEPEQVPRSTGSAQRRVQLFALSSKQRAEAAAVKYGSQYADILQGAALSVEPMGNGDQTVYRVVSDPVSIPGAEDICRQLKEINQSCLSRRIAGPASP